MPKRKKLTQDELNYLIMMHHLASLHHHQIQGAGLFGRSNKVGVAPNQERFDFDVIGIARRFINEYIRIYLTENGIAVPTIVREAILRSYTNRMRERVIEYIAYVRGLRNYTVFPTRDMNFDFFDAWFSRTPAKNQYIRGMQDIANNFG
jgi:hypothetical protein